MDMNYTEIAAQMSWHYGVIILNLFVIGFGTGAIVGLVWLYIALAKWSTKFIKMQYLDALNEIMGKDVKRVKA